MSWEEVARALFNLLVMDYDIVKVKELISFETDITDEQVEVLMEDYEEEDDTDYDD